MAQEAVESKKVTVKKGSKVTEQIIGSAALKVQMAAKALSQGIEEFAKLNEKTEEYTLKVVSLEDTLVELEQKKKNEINQGKIEVQQAFENNKKEFVDTYAMENNLTLVPRTDFNNMQTELRRLTTELNDTVSKEVGKAVAIANQKFESESRISKLEYEKKEAENSALIKQLTQQNTFLLEQVESWKHALEAERSAGIERQKASAIQNLNVGSNTGR